MNTPAVQAAVAAIGAELAHAYPCFAQAPPPGWLADLRDMPAPHTVPAGTMLFSEGSQCRGFPLLLTGEVRVAYGSSGGRELELYRVRAGEVCVVSATSLFAGEPMAGHGVTTLPTRMLRLPAEVFMRWTGDEVFRRFVFGVFATRMRELAQLAEAVAFQRLDRRLAAVLLQHGNLVRATHQVLADELGTAREMVTRLLHRFETAGWVRLGRERVELSDSDALRELASGHKP
jgi:CRP/FNR family transcriptional regulator, anaerobic regulatory protein